MAQCLRRQAALAVCRAGNMSIGAGHGHTESPSDRHASRSVIVLGWFGVGSRAALAKDQHGRQTHYVNVASMPEFDGHLGRVVRRVMLAIKLCRTAAFCLSNNVAERALKGAQFSGICRRVRYRFSTTGCRAGRG